MNAVVPPRRRGRPPKTLGGYSETRDGLLHAGMAVLTEKGFSAVGLDEILRAVEVPKGSFYHYFDSKEAFGLAVVDRYAAYFARKLDRFLGDDTVPPLQRLARFTEDAEAGMARYGFARGCVVGNLGQEMGALPASFRARLLDVFADWEARTARCLELARDAGEIGARHDPRQLAAFFWIGWEGAVLRAKLERHGAPLRLFADNFFLLLRA